MAQTNTDTRNPRYLAIPTLLVALVFGHVSQTVCASYGLSDLASTAIYIVALATPVIAKRAIFSAQTYSGPLAEPHPAARLPTSRFQTTSNYPSFPSQKRPLT
jgi:hypothetical protein